MFDSCEMSQHPFCRPGPDKLAFTEEYDMMEEFKEVGARLMDGQHDNVFLSG